MTTKKEIATIRYAAALTRVFRTSIKRGGQLHVSAEDENGYIFATDGVILVKLNRLEYDQLIRPITQRDPAAYVLNNNGLVDGRKPLDMEKILTDAADKSAAPVTVAPFTFAIDKKTNGAFFYNADVDTVVMVNADFVAAFTTYGTFKAGSWSSPVVIDQGDPDAPDPIALILPLRPKNNKIFAAVRAYYTDQPADVAQLAALHAKPQHKAPQTADKAEAVKALLDKLQIPYTVKGAQTAAPILWTAADPGDHAADLKAASMTWSAKRGAWYIKAA